jgi:pimeloyl-ACP methyl ester carboxylesterase
MKKYKSININNVNIAYREEGRGQPVILVHGFAASSYTWLTLVRSLPSGFRYIALDLKGFGHSDKPRDKNYSAYDQAKILTEFINELDLDNVVIIGHSFGGMVSLVSLISNSIKNRVAGLVLVDTVAYFKHIPDFIAKLRIPVASMLGLELFSPRELVLQVLKEVFYDHSKITEEMISAYAENLGLPEAKRSLVRSASQFASEEMKHIHEKFNQIRVPTLIISGSADRVIPVEESYVLKHELPHVELKVIPQCGHSPQEECPQETAATISEFLANIGTASIFSLVRQLKMRELFDRSMQSALRFFSFTNMLRWLKRLEPGPNADGWRSAAQSYLRTEHSKFILAAFRLDLWSDTPRPEDLGFTDAKKHLIKRLSLFLLDYPITHRKLRWGMFSTKKENKDLIDIVCAEFNDTGTLSNIEPFLDRSLDMFESINEDRKRLLNEAIVNAYNRLNNVKDEYRPRRLKRELLRWVREHPPVSKKATEETVYYLDRVLNSTFIHFEILPPDDPHGDTSRFKYPDVIKRKHPGFGVLNICCRLTVDFQEADLWFQISHVSIDGVPMQEILNSLKAQWKTCGDLVFPSVSRKKMEIFPELCSTKIGRGGRYHADQLIDFRPLLKIRDDLNKRYAAKLSAPITVISMLGWGLAHHHIFSRRRFLFPIDLPSVNNKERTLGFVSIRPSLYIDNPALEDSFLEYQLKFNRKLYRTQARISGIYKLFELFALLPSPVYWFMQKFMKFLFSEVVGSVVITTIKDADFFIAPSSDVILDGFIAFGNFSIPTKDSKMAGIVSVKTTEDKVRLYLNSIEEVAGDFGKYL